MKRLIINADDFGFTADVNAGIVCAHKDGVLTSTTLMANGDAFDHAVQCARETPTLDIGCHLVLVQGRSLLTGSLLPQGPRQLVFTLMRGGLDVHAELSVQIEKILASGIRPSHLDTHKHTHLLPQVFRTVARLANEFGIPYVRLPLDETVRLAGCRPTYAQSFYRRVAGQYGVSVTDHFRGFRLTGSLTEQTFAHAIGTLPKGTTEFMCHPGLLTAELAQAQTRLKESRLRELEALTSPRIRQLIEQSGIHLSPFSRE